MSERIARVYVVDDDPSVRRALARLFKSHGLPVETYASAAEFLGSRDGNAAGCIVLDVRMQGTTGPDLQKELRARGSVLPIVFITAHDDEKARREALDNGAIAYFVKPVSDDDLLKAVAAAGPFTQRGTP